MESLHPFGLEAHQEGRTEKKFHAKEEGEFVAKGDDALVSPLSPDRCYSCLNLQSARRSKH